MTRFSTLSRILGISLILVVLIPIYTNYSSNGTIYMTPESYISYASTILMAVYLGYARNKMLLPAAAYIMKFALSVYLFVRSYIHYSTNIPQLLTFDFYIMPILQISAYGICSLNVILSSRIRIAAAALLAFLAIYMGYSYAVNIIDIASFAISAEVYIESIISSVCSVLTIIIFILQVIFVPVSKKPKSFG